MEPTEFNALAFDQNSTRDPLQKHFIPREGSRRKGVEIEFDPTRHREWVTGFRKRKAERKTSARKKLEIRAKEERLSDRKKRFEEKKKNLRLPDDYGVGELDADEHPAPEKITSLKQHVQAGRTTVVTTTTIAYDSDDQQQSQASDSSGEEREQHHPLAVLAPAVARGLDKRPGDDANVDSAKHKHDRPKRRMSSAERLAKLKHTQGSRRGSRKKRCGSKS